MIDMSKYSELGEDYAEIGVDKIVQEASKYLPILQSVGEETPIVRTAIAAVSIPKTMSDAILASKVNAFLFGANLSEAKIDKFKKDFSKTKQEKLWKNVFHSVNSHDNEKKSEIVGKLFNSLVDGFICEHEFTTLVHATNTMNIATLDDLLEVYMFEPEVTLQTSLYTNFSNLGILNTDNSTVGRMGGGAPKYPPNNLGWKFAGIVYDFPPSGIDGVLVGQGQLIREIDNSGMVTGRSLPLKFMIENKLMYQEIRGYIVDDKNNILVDESTERLYEHNTLQVPPEYEPNVYAILMNKGFSKGPSSIRLSNANDEKQVWAFLLESVDPLPNTKFTTIESIEESLVEGISFDDDFRGLVIKEIKRRTDADGDLHDQWISAYDNTPVN